MQVLLVGKNYIDADIGIRFIRFNLSHDSCLFLILKKMGGLTAAHSGYPVTLKN